MAMDLISIPYSYITSLFQSLRCQQLVDDVETFVMFIGYPRSAHTLVGFLLDAHPNIIVASQTSALKYVKHGFTKQQMFYVLLQDSRRVAKVGRGQRRYSYRVPNQWQGRFQKLQIIGDSTGLTRLRREPASVTSLKKSLGSVQLKLIHCVRNPYDNISTMKLRSQRTLQAAIDAYFPMCETVEKIKNHVPNRVIHDLRHERLVADPKAALRGLCNFLGVNGDQSYYEDCASVVYKSPHKSRFEVAWDQELIADVECRMSQFSFFEGYSYDEEATGTSRSQPPTAFSRHAEEL
jgi:hypothetical protein